eukprot:TRINITY_DN5170_c0_g1_i2.p1 TRINITY_DN5170_c0_g1~~TRINITY_DN5170_c0_g1_i2.p1  ORF type:complete len:237 (+),score=34.14 TRINITY_DN5170_c0_g1_i2:235-945(+)
MDLNAAKINEMRRGLLSSVETSERNDKNYGVVINIESREKSGFFYHSKNRKTTPKTNLQEMKTLQREIEEFSKARLEHKHAYRNSEITKDAVNSGLNNYKYKQAKSGLVEALAKMRSYGFQLKELRKSCKKDNLSMSCSDFTKNWSETRAKNRSANSFSMRPMEDAYHDISLLSSSSALTKWTDSASLLGDDSARETARADGLLSEDLLVYYRGISEGTITDEESPLASARYKCGP